jgi:hypothetical protein
MNFYQPHLITGYLIYFLIVWFFLVSLSGKGERVNLVIFFMYVVNITYIDKINLDINSPEYLLAYIEVERFLVGVDVFFGLVMYALNKDAFTKYAWKQWSLLAFVVTCHFMILWDLSISQSWLTGKFYTYFDELIIIAGLLQMWVSRDGILTAISRLQKFDYGFFVRAIRGGKLLFKRKKREIKA